MSDERRETEAGKLPPNSPLLVRLLDRRCHFRSFTLSEFSSSPSLTNTTTVCDVVEITHWHARTYLFITWTSFALTRARRCGRGWEREGRIGGSQEQKARTSGFLSRRDRGRETIRMVKIESRPCGYLVGSHTRRRKRRLGGGNLHGPHSRRPLARQRGR